jgi:hypothetical protein
MELSLYPCLRPWEAFGRKLLLNLLMKIYDIKCLLTSWLLGYTDNSIVCRSFGTMLSPAEFSAQGHLTSELLRTL